MTTIRYFDGETWWFEQAPVCVELEISVETMRRWRRVQVGNEPLVRTRRMQARVLIALWDVFYVLENRERLFAAGVRLTTDEELARKRAYLHSCQDASLAFATRSGEEYTTKELREIAERDGTVFDAAILHQRTYYGARYAAARGRK